MRWPSVTDLVKCLVPALAVALGCAGPAASVGAGDGGGHADAGSPELPIVEPDLAAFAPPDVLARRLAQLIWNAEPDADLTAAMRVGPLTRDGIAAIAQKMLDDPRARAGVAAFYRHWLLFETRDPAGDPLRLSLQQEAPALGVYLTLDTPGTFAQLLTAPFTFVDETLAKHYGIAGITGPQMQKVAYPAGEPRGGLLTGAGVLAHFSSLASLSWPAKRGWLITDPLLCSPLVRSFLPTVEPDPSKSIRQQMIDVTSQVSCSSCHALLNPPGFAFIEFNAMGLWHREAGAAANETQGWIPDKIMPDAPTFDGPVSLAALLLGRDETRRCFVRQWLQYGVDRSVTVGQPVPEADVASVEVALRAFAASGYQLRPLIIAITRTNVFLR